MRGIEIFQKPSYREISPMRDHPMRGGMVPVALQKKAKTNSQIHTGGPRIGRSCIGLISL